MTRARYRDFPMPVGIAEQARRWLSTAEAERTVAPPRASATVLLVRETGQDGNGPAAFPGGAAPDVAVPAGGSGRAVEVFVLRRAAGMAFAGGMLAFPGGGVDARDADATLPWAGPDAAEWARRLGVGEPIARELVVAAAREVFEECGVLLAGPTPHEVVADLTDPSWDRERESLLDRSQSFAELLTRLGLVLRTDLLALRGHWTTPVCEPRRYDTRFFAARMPHGQVADDRSSEAEVAGWATPADLLRAQAEGREVLLPPTQVMLEQLALVPHGGLDEWLARPVAVHPVQPWPVEHSGGLWMRSPVGADGHGVPAPTTGER
jgi:8-oxo-dGTP pyrophosphatase MutT (NUDIX family)